MLQLKHISKTYKTGELTQHALNDVSLSLRDSEFVAILGPSGSGKTTLLNIIGGLDRYESGDLVINTVSTKNYKDRDWDSYRNHTIGFVFQSYNLIPHQNILSNVELALTISGISRSERKRRAKEALETVGLGEHIHKKPNQLSGGQMQRVAIARALVNNPDILLADEPTGALDSDTSVQVMELLKEVARDRLVVMVTHNPDLADAYATRIVKLRDGKITDDSDPFAPETSEHAVHKNLGKASMSFFTALSLSFNNLRTKKARTIMTAFAGSIGIIGIAMILSLSNGVNTYIEDIQKSTMISYPISIEAQAMDLSSLISAGQANAQKQLSGPDHELDAVYSDISAFEMASTMTTTITENNLTAFKTYLDDPDSEIHEYIGENGILYSYDTAYNVYTYDPDGKLVNIDGSTLMGRQSSSSGMMAMVSSVGNMEELMAGPDGESVSKALTESYDLLYGTWPSAYDELVLVVNRNNELAATTLYQLGLLPTAQYRELMGKLSAGEEISMNVEKFSYEDLCQREFTLIPDCDLYTKKDNGLFTAIKGTDSELEALMETGVKLKIVGVVRLTEESENALIAKPLGHTAALSQYIIDYTAASDIVTAQQATPDKNVLTGTAFSPADDDAKAEEAKAYLTAADVSEKASIARELMTSLYGTGTQMPTAMSSASQAASSSTGQGIGMQNMTDTQLAAMLEQNVLSGDGNRDALLTIYETYIGSGSYDDNMDAFGFVSLDAPSRIQIYADSFEAKEEIAACIERYNETAPEENQITYTDFVALLMSSVTTIVNVISYVLIAFVAVSLVVSSIMIGIITYISVLERTKEIGILRAIGASKKNITQVFNAETFIVGLFAGLMGVGITWLLLIPANAIIHAIADTASVNAALPPASAVLLVVLSVILTLIGGFIPSKKAARKDPVTALRTE